MLCSLWFFLTKPIRTTHVVCYISTYAMANFVGAIYFHHDLLHVKNPLEFQTLNPWSWPLRVLYTLFHFILFSCLKGVNCIRFPVQSSSINTFGRRGYFERLGWGNVEVTWKEGIGGESNEKIIIIHIVYIYIW